MIKHFVMAGLLSLALSLSLSAQIDNTKEYNSHIPDSLKILSHPIVYRPEFKPKVLFTDIPAIDTIETNTPGVKIVIYANNTWNFVRDLKDPAIQKIFNEHWNELEPNPYHVNQDKLPLKIKLALVDNSKDFTCPHQIKVYSPFGYRHKRRHMGVDLPLTKGTPVYSAFDGKVRLSKYVRGYGNLIIVRHANGLETFYAHLSKSLVKPGQWVKTGQVIGLGGSTGRSTGPHLHFETRFQGYAFDPQWIIDFENGKLRSNLFVLKKKYLDASSRYVPTSDDEEDDIYDGDTKDYEVKKAQHVADSVARVKAELEAKAAKYHVIRVGDSLSGIAKKYRTNVNSICRLNKGLTLKSTLKVGRKIRVK